MSIPLITNEFLKQLRKNSGMTQAQLAEKAGVTQGYIAQIEKGTVDPRLSVVNKILQILGEREQAITAEDIMTSNLLFGRPGQITEELTHKMLEAGYSQVPILDGEGYCIGTLHEDELLTKFMKKGHTLRWEPIEKVMSPPLPTFHKYTPKEIIEKLLEDIPAVLVIDDNGKVIGIITRSDFLDQF
jgi:predicted transcriptional regulator